MARVLFVQLQQFAFPGLYHLCGALREAGHGYEVVASNRFQTVREKVQQFKPDLIGFPCMTGMHRDILDFSVKLKKVHPECRVILGGIHPTLCPEIVENSSVDFICRGEGEAPLVDLLQAIEGGEESPEIQNISHAFRGEVRHGTMRPLADPLDDLPFPDYSVYSSNPVLAADTYPGVFMTRGCPFSCSYCHNSKQKKLYRGLGTYVRTFSTDRILAEVEACLFHYPRARAVLLGADTLGQDMEWLTDLLTRYSSSCEVPYTCLIRPEFITEEFARLLGETNCHMVAFGIESGSERIRRKLLRRGYSNERLLTASALLRKHGVRFRTYNIIGFPDETPEEMLSTLAINLDIRPEYPWCSIYTPYPETELADYAISQGYLGGGFSYDDVPRSFFNDTVLDKVDRTFVRNLHSIFQLAVLQPWLFPLLKRTLYLPHSPFHRFIFKLVYSYVCLQSERRSLLSYIRLALANRKFFE
jgi:radical SAM superfamily enzyme YgiQ (UPF0313 family)